MTESCCCPNEAGNQVCDLPAQDFEREIYTQGVCSKCKQKGKPVEGQTIKSMLSVSLREVMDINYLFCRTDNCPIVYFSSDGKQIFTLSQVRERVYQKEPNVETASVCYCFKYTVGEIINSSPENQDAIVKDINTGIKAGQCACDLRNPQGSCCLGNVRRIIKAMQSSET